jgi:hypothetical protein
VTDQACRGHEKDRLVEWHALVNVWFAQTSPTGVGRKEGSAYSAMAKKPFAKPRIVRRKEKLATIVQFTSGGTIPPRRSK